MGMDGMGWHDKRGGRRASIAALRACALQHLPSPHFPRDRTVRYLMVCWIKDSRRGRTRTQCLRTL